ncbi:hypothetical protein GGX14DRAFT_573843 [Mycena pura]|uniref:Uncharacterized protein n=1 Tax=Mycena pura TaxID=153505 RepID=A0AAD6UYF1_9AGAR|nr:hypothetical protein GGX14DRAFT_573843 [Mycena pura]
MAASVGGMAMPLNLSYIGGLISTNNTCALTVPGLRELEGQITENFEIPPSQNNSHSERHTGISSALPLSRPSVPPSLHPTRRVCRLCHHLSYDALPAQCAPSTSRNRRSQSARQRPSGARTHKIHVPTWHQLRTMASTHRASTTLRCGPDRYLGTCQRRRKSHKAVDEAPRSASTGADTDVEWACVSSPVRSCLRQCPATPRAAHARSREFAAAALQRPASLPLHNTPVGGQHVEPAPVLAPHRVNALHEPRHDALVCTSCAQRCQLPTTQQHIEMRRQRCRVSRGVALQARARSHGVERAHGVMRGIEAAVRGFETERAAGNGGAGHWERPCTHERARAAVAQSVGNGPSVHGAGARVGSTGRRRAAATLERDDDSGIDHRFAAAARGVENEPTHTPHELHGAWAPARGVENQGPSVGNGSARGSAGHCGASLDGGSAGCVENQGGGDAPSIGKRPVRGQRHGALRDWQRGPVIDGEPPCAEFGERR